MRAMDAISKPEQPEVPDTPRQKWTRIIVCFAIGLFLGPLLTDSFGIELTRGEYQRRLQDAVVEEEAHMCGMLVMEHDAEVVKLHYLERRALAEKYAKLTWSHADMNKVLDRCASQLGPDFQYGSGAKS